jgi:hypothetical protein
MRVCFLMQCIFESEIALTLIASCISNAYAHDRKRCTPPSLHHRQLYHSQIKYSPFYSFNYSSSSPKLWFSVPSKSVIYIYLAFKGLKSLRGHYCITLREILRSDQSSTNVRSVVPWALLRP